eukprot:CAMPEP_0171395568 /NCGR_PEP_ID=MMETSP0880-20121228/4042_1 /TAXON_ID=67004 /ORGANISM="Thalassiosira weissflogii, Strain CCMP1336" /LENGTH=1044 /DNA_ID=CAMNT_0011909083 /DNA_START=421 /DNA_END=3555 /DNA_ORIENTATION=+
MALAKAKEVIKNGGTQAEAAEAAKLVAKQALKESGVEEGTKYKTKAKTSKTTGKKQKGKSAASPSSSKKGTPVNTTGAKVAGGLAVVSSSREDSTQEAKKSSGSGGGGGGLMNLFKKKSKNKSPSPVPFASERSSTIAKSKSRATTSSSIKSIEKKASSKSFHDSRDDVASRSNSKNGDGASKRDSDEEDPRETITPNYIPKVPHNKTPIKSAKSKMKNHKGQRNQEDDGKNNTTNSNKQQGNSKTNDRSIPTTPQSAIDSQRSGPFPKSTQHNYSNRSRSDSEGTESVLSSRNSNSTYDSVSFGWNPMRLTTPPPREEDMIGGGGIYDGSIPSIYIQNKDSETVSVLTNQKYDDPNIMDILNLNHVMDAVDKAMMGGGGGSKSGPGGSGSRGGDGSGSGGGSVPSVDDEENEVNFFLLNLCRSPCGNATVEDKTLTSSKGDENDDFIDDGQYYSNHKNSGGRAPVTADDVLEGNRSHSKSVSWADSLDDNGGPANSSLVKAVNRGMENGKQSSDQNKEDGMPMPFRLSNPNLPPLHPAHPKSSMRNKWNNGNNNGNLNINTDTNMSTSPTANSYNTGGPSPNPSPRTTNSGATSMMYSATHRTEQGSLDGTHTTKETAGTKESSIKDHLRNLANSVNQNMCALMTDAHLVDSMHNGGISGMEAGVGRSLSPGGGMRGAVNSGGLGGNHPHSNNENWRSMVNDSMDHNSTYGQSHHSGNPSPMSFHSHQGSYGVNGPWNSQTSSSANPTSFDNQDSMSVTSDHDNDKYVGVDGEEDQGVEIPQGFNVPSSHGAGMNSSFNSASLPAAVMSVDSDDGLVVDRYSGDVGSPTVRGIEGGPGGMKMGVSPMVFTATLPKQQHQTQLPLQMQQHQYNRGVVTSNENNNAIMATSQIPQGGHLNGKVSPQTTSHANVISSPTSQGTRYGSITHQPTSPTNTISSPSGRGDKYRGLPPQSPNEQQNQQAHQFNFNQGSSQSKFGSPVQQFDPPGNQHQFQHTMQAPYSQSPQYQHHSLPQQHQVPNPCIASPNNGCNPSTTSPIRRTFAA